MSNLAIARLQKEVTMLQKDPPPGAWCGLVEGKLTELEAGIQGPAGTVYEAGVFKLSVHIPTRYPMEPPKVRFVTPVYHPNIDAEGRICLDILNPPPKGAWKPSLNISTVLSSIALLLSEPNPDDGLVTDTTYEYKHQREIFDSKARAWTRQHAVQMKQGETSAATIVEASAPPPTKTTEEATEPQQQKKQQQEEPNTAVEDETRSIPNISKPAEAVHSASMLPTKDALDTENKENGGGGDAGNLKRNVELQKPSLTEKPVPGAEEDRKTSNNLPLEAGPPQKKSKLSLHR